MVLEGTSERCLGDWCQANDHAGKKWKCNLCCSAGFSLTLLTYCKTCKVDLQHHKILDLYASWWDTGQATCVAVWDAVLFAAECTQQAKHQLLLSSVSNAASGLACWGSASAADAGRPQPVNLMPQGGAVKLHRTGDLLDTGELLLIFLECGGSWQDPLRELL